jgi:hypothetical protein
MWNNTPLGLKPNRIAIDSTIAIINITITVFNDRLKTPITFFMLLSSLIVFYFDAA